MRILSSALLLTILLAGCKAAPVAVQPVVNTVASSSSSVSSHEPIVVDLSEEPVPAETSVMYVNGPCNGEIPSTWKVRSAADQAIWNKEGNSEQPEILTSDMIFERLQSGDAVQFKPSVFSMADAETYLPGHSEDPGAEDANRYEIDVLKISGKEVAALRTRLLGLTTPLNQYYLSPIPAGSQDILTVRNIQRAGKYYGMELKITPESAPGKADGLIFYNRSNDEETDTQFRSDFRKAAIHYFETMDPNECPQEWHI